MTEQLPIVINIHSDLLEKFAKLTSVCNKLEAQFNFQTLTANWYGDEETVLSICLALQTPESYRDECEALQTATDDEVVVTVFSDDVTCSINEQALQWYCYIALTPSELELLAHQPKLLAGFIQVKLQKVLNLIAKERSLTLIALALALAFLYACDLT